MLASQQVAVIADLDDHACTPLCRHRLYNVLDEEALSCPQVLPNTTTLPLLTTVTLDPEYRSFAVRDCQAPTASVHACLPGS